MEKLLNKKFRKLFGEDENLIHTYFAPGRVNLIGEHTDYNGGHVFPCALTMGTYALVRKRSDKEIRFYSMNLPKYGVIKTNLMDLTPLQDASWTNYPMGVVWAFGQHGFTAEYGFDALIYGTIPTGSGLSSSASLEVLTGLFLRELNAWNQIPMIEIAQLGQYAENKFCGMNCGIMDQFASAMGKNDCAIFLDTNTLDYEYVPLHLGEAKIVIVNSKVKHSLVNSAYNDRRKECESALHDLQKKLPIKTLGDLTEKEFNSYKHLITSSICAKRARHAVYENQRTIRAVKKLDSGDIEGFGKLMTEAHFSLRDDYEVSCAEIDLLIDLALNTKGIIGARMTGAGFGGCTVNIVDANFVENFKKHILSEYKKQTGIDAEIYVTEIGGGAHAI